MDNMPKVSIITTTYNDIEHLKEVLGCILMQNYENIECIVIDGGSKDSTPDFLQEISLKFQGKLKWISEKDSGIYDAINKGYHMATGDIIGCLFDLFVDDNVINKIVNRFLLDKCDGIHSDLVYFNNDRIVRYWKMGNGTIRTGWMPGFPTLFLKREVYEKYGLFKTDYRCSGDYEFIVRIMKDKELKLSYIPEVLIKMYYGGTSTGGYKAYWRSIKESHRALKDNNISFPILIILLRTLRVIKQFVKSYK